MLVKAVLSPFFAPIMFILLWCLCIGGLYIGVPEADILNMTADGRAIDIVAKIGYLFLIVLLFCLADDFKNKLRCWGLYVFFAMMCFLRESGIQHHLSTTDTTLFKSRFFLDAGNPLYEKFIFGIVLLMILGGVLYLAQKYAKYLVRSFFKLDTVTWSIATLCTTGVFAKIIDRFPSNYRKFHDGEILPQGIYTFLQVLEETSEMFLPYLAMLILAQYHILLKGKR